MLSTDYILLRRLRLKIDLIPGPPHNDKVLYSAAIQVIARYPAQPVATAISAIPGVSVVTEGVRDPRAWQWVWRNDERSIRLGFSLLGKDAGPTAVWGGSTLECDCFVGDVLSLWAQIRRTHPDTWLHYDGRVYTVDSLLEKLRTMLEAQVISDIV